MYSIIEIPDCCDPFAEPRNTTEQIKVLSERLTFVITYIDSYVEATLLTVRRGLYQLVTW